jgi:magnesium transporter
VLFVVLRTARYVEDREEVDVGEVSVFLSRRFVVTVRHGEASNLHGARMRLEERPELLREGSGAVLWAILDTIVDDYAPVIEGLERDVEEVEKTVFSGAAAPTGRIYLLRREATDFYRAVHPLLAPLEALERGTYIHVSEELRQFLRDVNDHLKLVNEEIIALRDVLATIFLPLTFITGFFGMNFGWMINDINSFWIFAVYGVGSLLLSAFVIYYWFRRSGDI